MKTLRDLEAGGFPRRLLVGGPHTVVQMSRQSHIIVACVAHLSVDADGQIYVDHYCLYQVDVDLLGGVRPLGTFSDTQAAEATRAVDYWIMRLIEESEGRRTPKESRFYALVLAWKRICLADEALVPSLLQAGFTISERQFDHAEHFLRCAATHYHGQPDEKLRALAVEIDRRIKPGE